MRPLFPALVLVPWVTCAVASAGDVFGKLPDWAQAAAREAAAEAPPAGAEAWVLLDRTEVAYAGGGTLRVRQLRLVKVLSGKGLEEAGFGLGGLREGAESMKELKGWNLRPDGEMVKLGRRDRATVLDLQGDATFDTAQGVVALLPRVVDGSLVAYECVVEWKALVDVTSWHLMERHPVRRWEFQVLPGPAGDGGVTLWRRDFSPWISGSGTLPDGTIRVAGVPPLPVAEPFLPPGNRYLPRVELRFKDPAWPGSKALDSWADFSAHFHGVFAPHIVDVPSGGPAMGRGLEGLQALWAWFARELTYKQVYLTAARGLEPETSTEVARKRYGDCKDLTCLFLALARRAGFEGVPALARINEPPITAGEAGGPPRNLFNHAIAALRLETSLGLPGEVVTPAGRFLLVDPTDPFTPLGRLDAGHRDGRVLLCLPAAGAWAEVPAGAILHRDLDIAYQGTLTAGGALEAEVLLRETGSAWGLRPRAHSLSRRDFRAYIESRCLDGGIDGGLEVVSTGDPLDLSRPFDVRLKVSDPRALTRHGSDLTLKLGLGLPAQLAPLARPGQKRRSPVLLRGDGRTFLHGAIAMPQAVRPLLPENRAATPRRELSWKVAAEPSPQGCSLVFQVEQRLRDTAFGVEALDAAEDAWRKDRALVRGLLMDGMAFKP